MAGPEARQVSGGALQDGGGAAAVPNRDLLVVSGVSKRFGPTVALDGVSVTFRAGEVHALMGENGAGKSTLGKVIAGLHRADSGTVSIGGAPLRPGSIDDAFGAGVRIVHQELAQCPNLSVAENLCLHQLPARWGVGGFGGLGRVVDFRAMQERAERLLSRLEPAIDVRRPLGTLSPGHRQIVQIASALDDRGEGDGPAGQGGAGGRARVIVFDEPTSSLAVAEVERLLQITRRLAAEGITIIYVSHRMGEIFAACDRVTVLRDGRYIATTDVALIDEPTLVEQMIGRRIEGVMRRGPGGGEAAALRRLALGEGSTAPAREAAPQGARLVVEGLRSAGKLEPVSLSVGAGEIVGVGGLVGSGLSELLDAIFGLDAAAVGRVCVDGAGVHRGGGGSARRSIDAGVGYVPEDRKLQGLFFELGIDENISMPVMARLARLLGIRSARAEAAYVGGRLRMFQVKAASARSRPGELSGGNQQKLLIARWMGERTRVLLLDEPTRGIDVGTKSEVYRLIHDAAAAGMAVLLVSSEMPELLALSDRILVMCNGRISGEVKGEGMTQAAILRLATADEAVVRQGTAAACA